MLLNLANYKEISTSYIDALIHIYLRVSYQTRFQDNDVGRAVDWIFSHVDELHTIPMETDDGGATHATPSQAIYRDGTGSKYFLNIKYRFFKYSYKY